MNITINLTAYLGFTLYVLLVSAALFADLVSDSVLLPWWFAVGAILAAIVTIVGLMRRMNSSGG